MPKECSLEITTIDGLLECTIKPGTTGKDLMSQIGQAVKVKELYFFGIQYTDDTGELAWLRFDRKVLAHPIKKEESPMQMRFLLKYYPEDFENEISEASTLRLIYLQVKSEVMQGKLKMERVDTNYLLASYVCQVKFGDYNESRDLNQETLVPNGCSPDATKIANLWAKHTHMSVSQAMLEFIKTAKLSPTFGMTFFPAHESRKSGDCLVGVNTLGMNLCEPNNNATPKVSVTWPQIRKIAYKGERVNIKLNPMSSSPTAKTNDVVFYTDSRRRSKQIIGLCMGNIELYARRHTGALQVSKFIEGLRSDTSSAYEDGSDIDMGADTSTIGLDVVYQPDPVDAGIAHLEQIVPEPIPEETTDYRVVEEKPVANGTAHKEPPVAPKTEEKGFMGKLTDRMKQRFVSMCCFYTP